MKLQPIFISGIDTGVGKTIVSAIIVEKLQADYWKPIQSGDLNHSDLDQVKSLVTNKLSKFHPEAYRLTHPYSPHKSADLDGVKIDIEQIVLPQTENALIIEGAGGLMVPLNEKYLMIDLIQKLKAEVVLVVSHYLGSINHSLLSMELLMQKNIPIKGLIINGPQDVYSENILLNYNKKIKFIGRVDHYPTIDAKTILAAKDGLDIQPKTLDITLQGYTSIYSFNTSIS